MEELSAEKIPLTREQKAALFLEARLLLALVQNLLLKARAQHEEDERKNLCYRTQVSPVGKPLC